MLIFVILLLLINLTLFTEFYLVKPTLLIKQREKCAFLIHTLATLFVFVGLFIIFHRLIFSAVIALGLHLLITGINNAKYQALKEGMVFSDIVMFSQAFRHPRLYFPFVKTWLLISFPLLILAILVVGLKLESPLYLTDNWNDSFLGLVINLILFLTIHHLINKQHLSLEPNQDLAQFGLLASLTIGLLKSRQQTQRQAFDNRLAETPFSTLAHAISGQALCDIIVVQSESFFDIRRLYAAISTDILKNYDAVKLEAQFAGRLNVPAWGANTMRTEFSFLSGLNDQDTGLFRYYPYHYLNHEICSIATYLKRQGYRTICIHPYLADFFERQRVFPLLGFDEFIDIHHFSEADYAGAYISDLAVAKKIAEVQQTSKQPLFIFAITMENHGPLHLENITAQNEIDVYQTKPDFDSHDMTAYLRHLKNADAMIAYLIAHFQQRQTRSCFCFYGDHVPSIPAAYQALQFENSQSDYFIWQSHTEKSNYHPQTLDANQLGILLVKSVLEN